MTITILAFAQARETLGFSSREIQCASTETPEEILRRAVPGLPIAIAHLRVALDGEYSGWHTPVGKARELAVIPPVSGG
jgi:molybdopterin synthase sulfur carrier subunit